MKKEVDPSIPARVSLRDLSKAWACSQRHITRLVESGRLPGIDIGVGKTRKVIFDPEDIRAFELASYSRQRPEAVSNGV